MTADATIRFAFDLLVKATALFGATLFTIRGWRRAPAALRHRVAGLGLLAGVALPALTLLLPSVEVPLLTRRAVAESPAGHARAGVENAGGLAIRPEISPLTPPAPDLWGSPADPSRALGADASSGRGLALLAVFAWAAGTVLFLSRAIARALRRRSILRQAEPLEDVDAIRLVLAAAARMSLRRPVEVLVSPRVESPRTLGSFFPGVLLPPGARRWSAERLRVAVLHELAHVKRRDPAARLLAELGRAIYWFHPLARALARALESEDETASDDLVLSAGVKPPVYAAHLLGISRSAAAAIHSTATHTLPLDRRLGAILEVGHPRAPLTATTSRLLAFAFAAAAGALALFEPAQSRPAIASSKPERPVAGFVGAAGAESLAGGIPIEGVCRESKARPESRAHLVPRHVSEKTLRSARLPKAARDFSSAGDAGPSPNPAPREAALETRRSAPAQPARSATSGGAVVSETWFSDHDTGDEGADWYARGMALHRKGRYCEAIAAFRRSIALRRREEASTYNVACGYARMGEKDRAFEWLEKARAEGFALSDYLRQDDDLDSLRGDPRFERVLRAAVSHDGG